jgi:hypothetical protein
MAKRPLTTVYDQAIQRVQEWNAALNGKSLSETLRRLSKNFLIISYTETPSEDRTTQGESSRQPAFEEFPCFSVSDCSTILIGFP